METNNILDVNNDLYIVYRYNIHNSNTTKYIMGIYASKKEAINRQKLLCPIFNKYFNTYTSNKGDVTFINKVKLGDSDIEMFTT
jgi:hypothetical protein